MPQTSPKIAIILIHYNTPHYLKTCLDSIFAQTYKNIDVYFIDNNSPDKSGLEFVKTYESEARKSLAKSKHFNLKIIANKENLGYARAANQGIRLAVNSASGVTGNSAQKPSYIVITNPDIIYTPKYFEKVVHRAEKANHAKANHATIKANHTTTKPTPLAGITGKVYKYDFANRKPTKIIDTVGLYMDKSLRVVDGGQGHEDTNKNGHKNISKFNKEKEVFGISGACPLYKREALEDAALINPKTKEKEYFDEDFFMYKEDVDLSWRLQLLGWKFLYYPDAVAFHGRGTGVVKRDTIKEIHHNRANLSRLQRYYSYRNQNLMILKNLLWLNYFKFFFNIFLRDLGTFAYVLFREPFILKSIPEYFKLMPRMLNRRRQIMKKRKARL